MILVTGATGNVGGELVRALAGAGQPVRALTRDDNPREFPAGVQQAPGDLNKPDSMRTALSGTTAVFLYPGYQDTAGTLAEARRAGVRRVVMLSVLRLLRHRHARRVAAPAGRPRRYRPKPAHVPPMGRRPRERLQPVIPVSAVLRKRALGRVFP